MPIQLTSQAYCKMLLHAAKYPHCAVNGLLVAEKTKDKKKESHSEPVLCVDCVPLFHGTLALAPMLEVALTLVSSCFNDTFLSNRYLRMYSFLKLFEQKVNLINWKRLCSICFPVSYLRSILGVKKIIMSLLDIIKPMNGRRMQGEFPQSGH